MAFSRYGTARAADTGLLAGGWRDRAACRGRVCVPEDDVWFAPDGERADDPQARARERVAKRVCARCPVRVDCLAFALATGQQHGVWGGLSGAELAARRRALRRSRPATRTAGAGR